MSRGHRRSCSVGSHRWWLTLGGLRAEAGAKHQDNANVAYEACPKVVPEEQNVNADHDSYERKHVKHDGRSGSLGNELLVPGVGFEPTRSFRTRGV